MPTAIAGGAASFLIGAGASAGVAAVGGAIAAGVVTGAVIGAATAVLTGGDILDGALKGALVGGIAGGVLSAGSMALSGATGSEIGLGSAANQLESYGVGVATPPVDTTVSANLPGSDLGGAEARLGQGPVNTTQPGLLSPTQTSPVTNMSPEKANIYAGIGRGAAEGIGKVGAAMLETEGAQTLSEQKRADEAAAIARNQPGEFETRIANITLPERWEAYNIPAAKPAGMLA